MKYEIEIPDGVIPYGYEPVAFSGSGHDVPYITSNGDFAKGLVPVGCRRLILKKKHKYPFIRSTVFTFASTGVACLFFDKEQLTDDFCGDVELLATVNGTDIMLVDGIHVTVGNYNDGIPK